MMNSSENQPSGMDNNNKNQQSRRHFLKIAGTAAAVGAGMGTGALNLANLFAQTSDWVITSGFPASGTYLSPVQKIADPFTAVGTYWEVNSGDGNKLDLQLRSSQDGKNFGAWIDTHPEADGKANVTTSRFYGRLQFLTGPYVQFQLSIPSGLSLKLVGLTFSDTSAGPVSPSMPPAISVSPGAAPPQPAIISRAGWGANESYRFDKSGQIWPPEYRPQKMCLVHHSETTNTYTDNPASEVRGIYYYHAVTKGWGDIAYNYLIDWKGNIYEGRYGGDNVVGGHAYQYSYGSVGICLIGSFKTVAPTKAMIESLIRLMAWKCYVKGINPQAKIFFVDRNNVESISGHRDVVDTSCPGDVGYSLLPSFRQQVAALLPPGTPTPGTYNVAFNSLTFSPTSLKVGDLLKVEAVIKNTGTLPLETQDPQPGYIYDQGQAWDTLNFDKVTSKFRLAVDFVGNNGTSHPYRWGLGKTLNPGETVTVTGFIRMKNQGQVSLYGGIIQEYFKYFVDNVSTTQITTGSGVSKPTSPAPPTNAPGSIYFPETQHNLGGAFYTYWKNNGGLAIFGYPLTEEFKEESPTEPGKIYTVQYFQRNRFEYHPEKAGTPYEVLLGLLGVQLTQGRNFPKVPPVPNTSDLYYFPETNHTLSGAFFKYWKTYGGLPIFGYPISQEFQEKNPDDGKTYTVQYFERNRFEYHPENKGTRYEVLLGLLGTQLCRVKGWL
jgi:hypothetical protein